MLKISLISGQMGNYFLRKPLRWKPLPADLKKGSPSTTFSNQISRFFMEGASCTIRLDFLLPEVVGCEL